MLLRFIKLRDLIENNKFPLLLLFFSFILISFLPWQNYSLRKELLFVSRISRELNNDYINTDGLQNIVKKYLLKPIREKAFKWNLIIIFSPEDCPFCIDEISFWDNYFKQQKEPFLGCWGLVIHPFPELVNDFINNMGWEFPIFISNDSLDHSNFLKFSTPLKVLMKSTKNIYYIEGPDPNWFNKSTLKNLITYLQDH